VNICPGLVVVALLSLLGTAACTGAGPDAAPTGGATTISVPPTPHTPCPAGSVPVDLSLPADRSDVRLRVLNGSGVPGTADFVAGGLAQFGYKVVETGDVVGDANFPEVAVLRFGPRGVGDAWLVKSNFPDPVRLQFEPQREDDAVDVVVGQAFQFLRTTTEVNQAVAQAGKPTAPAGGCAQS
jgi:hypothetical protein